MLNKNSLLKTTALSVITLGVLLTTPILGKSVQADAIDTSNNLQSEDIKVNQADTDVTQVHNVTETVNYVYADGTQAAPSKTTTISFTRVDIENKKNGTIVNPGGGWNMREQTFAAVISPHITGYQADNEEVESQTVNPDSQNLSYTVTYYPVNSNNSTQNNNEVTVTSNSKETKNPLSESGVKQATTRDKNEIASLPQTGVSQNTEFLVVIMGIILSLLSILGISKKVEEKL